MTARTRIALSIDKNLVDRARKKGLDFAEVLEHALRRYGCEDPQIADARAQKWREDYREAIEQYNRHIEKDGLWWESLVKTRKPKRQAKKPARRANAR